MNGFDFLDSVAEEYGIQKGETESYESWMGRLIYSYLGQVGYSALFDPEEDGEHVSIVHFKKRIAEAFQSIASLYPRRIKQFPEGSGELEDEIYEEFLAAGYIYHEPNRIAPSIRVIAQGNGAFLSRGLSLDERKRISGLGFYLSQVKDTDVPEQSMQELFDLPVDTLEDAWNYLLEKAQFTAKSSDFQLEYLRVNPPYTVGYWEKNPNVSGEVALARTTGGGVPLYYLYKTYDGEIRLYQLPIWMTEDKKYRNIAVACLAARKVLPPTSFHVDGSIVTVSLNYLYPPEEMNLLRVYSWPIAYTEFPKDFVRVMSIEVFNEIREVFELRGYLFREE